MAGYFFPQVFDRARTANARRILAGVVLSAGAIGIHRLYWSTWRWARIEYGKDSPEALWFPDNGAYLEGLIMIVLVGYSLHLHNVFRQHLGRSWWLGPAALFALLTDIGYWIVS